MNRVVPALILSCFVFLTSMTRNMEAAPGTYQYNVISVVNTQPGQSPQVTFSVTDPANGNQPYDIKSDPAFTHAPVSRLAVAIGWDTREYTNTGSGSEFATPPSAAQPISVDALANSVSNGNGTFTVTSPKPIPLTASGTGVAVLEGRPAAMDATGAYTVTIPVKTAYGYFAITGTTTVARRQVVDRNRCNTCHPTLAVHGNNRTDQLMACVVCHNSNATDIPYRLYSDGPEEPIDFKYLVHAIHAGSTRKKPFVVIGFNHSVNDFSKTVFPAPGLGTCEACHLPGTYQVVTRPGKLGTTAVTNSVLTSTQKTVDNNPADNLRITPIAAACSACHGGSIVRSHIIQNGGAFDALQQNIDSGAVAERCVNCHGQGKPNDISIAHLGGVSPTAPRLTSISRNSGVLNSSVAVTITGVNLSGSVLSISGSGVTVSNFTAAAAQVTATLNIAASAAVGPRTIKVSSAAGVSNGLIFTVVPPAPSLASITPATGAAGTSASITINGANLSGAQLAINGTGVTISGTTSSAAQIKAVLNIGSSASGAYILTAVTTGGTSNGVVFTVSGATSGPTLTSISPASLALGGVIPITLTGTNFASGATVAVSGAGVTAGSVTVVSATQITAVFTVASNAATGSRSVSVTSNGLTSNAVAFTVIRPPAPTLTAPASPNQGRLGQSVAVTLLGTNFIPGGTGIVFTSGTGVTATNIMVISSTQMTATFVIAANASLDGRLFKVFTSGGYSSVRGFIVVP
jgi:hypothetical protein